jgi:hypothetical protein
MFQFGEVLALLIGFLPLTYLLIHWRRIRAHPLLGRLIGPFVAMFVCWTATVVEGVFTVEKTARLVELRQNSVGLEDVVTAPAQLLNLVEHGAAAVAAVWLLLILWRAARSPGEACR